MDDSTIHYCLSYPLVLTRRCGYACGYCRFPVGPRRPLPPKSELQQEFGRAARLGAAQIELIAGESLAHLSDVKQGLRYLGHNSFVEYLAFVLDLLAEEAPAVLPLLNVGNLRMHELELLRPRLGAVQVYLESLDSSVLHGVAHQAASAKDPERRLETILNCGRLDVPVATGTMLGIGEDDSSHLELLEVLAKAIERYRHVQSFEIQTFWPIPGTPMEHEPPVDDDDLLNLALMARDLLPEDVPVLVKAHEHSELIGELLDADVRDLGPLSLRLDREDDPRCWRGVLARAAECCAERGLTLRPRLPLHEGFQDEKHFPAGYPDRLQIAKSKL